MGILDNSVENGRDKFGDKKYPPNSGGYSIFLGSQFPQELLCIYRHLTVLLGFPGPYNDDDLFI